MPGLQRNPDTGKVKRSPSSGKALTTRNTNVCCCEESTPFYQFKRCDDGTLTDWYADPADAPPGTPSVGSPWFIFDHVHQLCLYTEGDLAVPPSLDDVLQPDEREDITDCSDSICTDATEIPPFDPLACECPFGSGDYISNLAIITLSVTACQCGDPCPGCSGGTSGITVTSGHNVTIIAPGACGYGGWVHLKFDTHIFGCTYSDTWTCNMSIAATVDPSTLVWTGTAFTLFACGSNSHGSTSWDAQLFNNSGTVGTCAGVVMTNEYTQCDVLGSSAPIVGYGGTMTVTLLTVAP